MQISRPWRKWGRAQSGAARPQDVRAARRPARDRGAAGVPVLLAMCGALGLGCGGGGQSVVDAGPDRPGADTPPASDAGPQSLALDFSVTGCSMFDLQASRCAGSAPLTVTFTPIASAELTRFLWTFGDDSPFSSERSPTHTYSVKGPYTVMLSAGGAESVGSLQQVHAAYVDVQAAPVGAVCDVDQQCEAGATCWCGSAAPCPSVSPRGFCGLRCDADVGDSNACPDQTTCVDLGTDDAAPPAPTTMAMTANVTWRRSLCLPVCASDDDCAAGFRCRDLPAPSPVAKWVRACFAPYPFEIGARCGDALGQPVAADCGSHSCADLGAYGRCSADCGARGCPPGAGCAHFGDGRNLCLANCTSSSTCSDDPFMACEAPGAAGPLGFSVTESAPVPTPPPHTFCAPKRCSTPADCGPTGTCPAGGGHCARAKA